MRTPLIATIIALLVLNTLGCVGQEKTPEMSFGEEWYGKTGIAVRSVAVGDVDRDGVPELITGGDLESEGSYTGVNTAGQGLHPNGLLRIWHWTGTALTLEHSEEWVTRRGARVNSVDVGDVDGDGVPEIITGGWANIGTGDINGQLRIWHWTGNALTLEHSEEWYTGADTEVKSIAVGDGDGDGIPEVITGGFARDGPYMYGQLRIWHWTGTALQLVHSEEWRTDTRTGVISIAVGDGDGDGVPELITGGIVVDGTRLKGQLRIWHWTGSTLHLEQSEEWATRWLGDAVVWSVAVGDVDRDGIPELITGGRIRVRSNYKGQLRIWHWTGTTLTLERSEEWITDGDTAVWSVAVGDGDRDGIPELITGGFTVDGAYLKGQLRIWHWTGTALHLERSEEWTTGNDTAVLSVAVGDGDGDGDGDGVLELITGGVVGTADRGIIIGDRPPPEPTPFKSQLRIWHWTGTTLTLERSEEWVSNVVSCSK